MINTEIIDLLKSKIIQASRMLLPYMTKSYHGNISARIPNTDTILLTASSYLHENLGGNDIVEVSLNNDDGLDTLHQSSLEIVNMHRVIYDKREDIGAVIHTHSPGVTGYAIAGEEIPCAYEAMVRNAVSKPIKVAKYAPRGSEQAIQNIQTSMGDNKAVLLANHGILAFDADPVQAARVIIVLEESAQMYIHARIIGKIQPIPEDMIKKTTKRKEEFVK